MCRIFDIFGFVYLRFAVERLIDIYSKSFVSLETGRNSIVYDFI